MNEVYALDPNACFGIRDLKIIINQCGFSEGRFLARLPKQWASEVLGKFSGVDRSRALVLLQKASLLDCRCRYDPTRPWLHNAIGARSESDPRIENIITDSDAEGAIELTRLLEDPEFRLKDSRGAHISRTVSSYLNACDPLFRASGEIFLVDKFFTCWHGEQERINGRQLKVLSAFLSRAERYGVCQRLVVINSREICLKGRTEESWAEQLESVLKEAGGRAVELEYAFMEEIRNDADAAMTGHARYIFSRLGGLQFDHGFDLDGASSQKNHVHWLSPQELGPLFAEYSSVARTF